MMIYGDGDPSLPMVARERTCRCHWCASLDKVTLKYIKLFLQFEDKQISKFYKDAKTMDDAKTKYHVMELLVVVIWSCLGGRHP